MRALQASNFCFAQPQSKCLLLFILKISPATLVAGSATWSALPSSSSATAAASSTAPETAREVSPDDPFNEIQINY
jgi:hypothetical protein